MCSVKYGYIGRWRGPFGIATAELIAPEWIITAPHVVSRRIQYPDTDVTVCFEGRGEKISARVVEPFLRSWECGQTWERWKQSVGYEWEEVALARLARQIDGITPVGLAENMLLPGVATRIKVVTAMGTSLEAHCELANDRRILVRDKGGGVQGDSGGAWLIEQRNGQEALVGIMQGTKGDQAVAAQPAVRRGWIDTKLREFGAKANWVIVAYS